MNCIQCGAPLPDGAAFCAACGAKQLMGEQAPSLQNDPGQGYPQQTPTPQSYPGQGYPQQAPTPQNDPGQNYPQQAPTPQNYPGQGYPQQAPTPQSYPGQGYPQQAPTPQNYPQPEAYTQQSSIPQGYYPQGYPAPGGMDPMSTPPNPKKSKMWILILVIVLLLVAAAAVVLILFFPGSDEDSSDASDSGSVSDSNESADADSDDEDSDADSDEDGETNLDTDIYTTFSSDQNGCATGEEAVEKYFAALEALDYDAILDCYPEAMLTAMLDDEGVNREEMVEVLEDTMGNSWEGMIQPYIEEAYGDVMEGIAFNAITFDVEINDSEPGDESDWSNFSSYIEDANLTVEETMLYDVTVNYQYDMTIDLGDAGEEDFDFDYPYDMTAVVLQVDGLWYCVNLTA